jgi:hypothetical protein
MAMAYLALSFYSVQHIQTISRNVQGLFRLRSSIICTAYLVPSSIASVELSSTVIRSIPQWALQWAFHYVTSLPCSVHLESDAWEAGRPS